MEILEIKNYEEDDKDVPRAFYDVTEILINDISDYENFKRFETFLKKINYMNMNEVIEGNFNHPKKGECFSYKIRLHKWR